MQPVEEGTREFLGRWCAKTDRVRGAFSDGYSVVGPVGRQIEHVAGFQHPLLGGPEIGEDSQRRILHEATVALVADSPVTLACALQQEDIVVVEMRTDPAAVGRVADHQVVETRLWNEAEIAHQRVAGFHRQVDPLDENRPGLAFAAQVGHSLRAGPNLPLLAMPAHET